MNRPFHVDGPVERWRLLRDTIHGQICRQGFRSPPTRFRPVVRVQELDASLSAALVWLSACRRQVRGTVAAIERHLLRDGLVHRYEYRVGRWVASRRGGLLACLLAGRHLHALGRDQDARRLFEHLLALRNDVGLLSESMMCRPRRLVGNFPQAPVHIGLVTTALNLSPQAAAPGRTAPAELSGRTRGRRCHDGCRETWAPDTVFR